VVTVAISGGAAFIRFACHAFSPSAGMTFALDQVNSAEGSGTTTPSSGTVTPTVASELVYGGLITVSSISTLTPGVGFTGLTAVEIAIWSEYAVLSAIDTVTANGTWSGNVDWTAIVATFAEVSAGDVVVPSTPWRQLGPVLAQLFMN
jgi:hypothetical protein